MGAVFPFHWALIALVTFGTMNKIPAQATTALLGKIKSFGFFGPKYEVGRPLRQTGDGDWVIEIIMVESGERAEYPLSHMLDDPEAP